HPPSHTATSAPPPRATTSHRRSPQEPRLFNRKSTTIPARTAWQKLMGRLRAAVGYAIRAAELADRRYAYDVAVSLLEQALDASARAAGTASERAEQQADLLGRLLRAQIRAGRIAAARATRQRAAD